MQKEDVQNACNSFTMYDADVQKEGRCTTMPTRYVQVDIKIITTLRRRLYRRPRCTEIDRPADLYDHKMYLLTYSHVPTLRRCRCTVDRVRSRCSTGLDVLAMPCRCMDKRYTGKRTGRISRSLYTTSPIRCTDSHQIRRTIDMPKDSINTICTGAYHACTTSTTIGRQDAQYRQDHQSPTPMQKSGSDRSRCTVIAKDHHHHCTSCGVRACTWIKCTRCDQPCPPVPVVRMYLADSSKRCDAKDAKDAKEPCNHERSPCKISRTRSIQKITGSGARPRHYQFVHSSPAMPITSTFDIQ